VAVGVGYDAARDDARRVHFCPRAGASVSFGPRNYMLRGVDFSRREALLGLGLALVLVQGDRLTVVPVAGASAHRLRVTPRSAWWDPRSDTYGMAQAAVGITIWELLTVRPGVTVPFGLVEAGTFQDYAAPFGREEREVSVSLRAGVTLRPGWRLRPPAS
jgi:hypothetical protein